MSDKLQIQIFQEEIDTADAAIEVLKRKTLRKTESETPVIETAENESRSINKILLRALAERTNGPFRSINKRIQDLRNKRKLFG